MSRAPALAGICALFGCVWQFGDPAPEPDSVTVAPQGGVVSFPGGPALRIPAGALREATKVSIVQSAALRPSRAVTSVYEFKPAETAFAHPATVSFPLPAGTREAVIYWSGAGASHYEQLQTIVEADAAEAQVTHLGTGYVATPVGADRTVSGALSTVFWADDGTKTERDGAPSPPKTVSAILVPNGSGYDRFRIQGSGARFSVPGVPEGRYLLQVDVTYPATDYGWEWTVSRLIELTTSNPDLSTLMTGRPDLSIAKPSSTPVTLDVSNLIPWSGPANGYVGDSLLIAGSQAHTFMGPTIAGRPPLGSTTGHFEFDWASASITDRAGFPDASKGDVEYIYQRATRPVGGGSTPGVAHAASRFQRLDQLTLREGLRGAIQATLADAPQTGTVRADLRNAQFAALLPQVNPRAKPSPTSGGVSVLTVPHSIEFPDQPDWAATSLLWVQGPSTVNVDYGPVAYGQFLGPMWKEMRYVIYGADVELPVPGSTSTYLTGGWFFSFVPASSQTPIAPELGPPAAVRIEGRDAFTSQSGVGVSPLISWSPPGLGTATSYVVKIDLVNLGPPAKELQEMSIAVYSGNSIRVPAGFLQTGRQYVLTVTAVSAPWDVLDHPPFRIGTPQHSADCVSAIFSP